jgi:hypothetical protein
MVKILKNSAIGYKEIHVSYQLFRQEERSKKLAIMLPGKGYTVQGPLFHFSTGVFLNKGYDVLHMNYNYNTEESDAMKLEEHIEQINVDVNSVLDQALSEHSYEQYTLIGKSLGTIALSATMHREEFAGAKAIWLTPLLQLDLVYNNMLSALQPGLCIIGEEDPCYIKERFDDVALVKNMTAILIPGTDHSLNYKDKPVESIDVLKRVITEISNFD